MSPINYRGGTSSTNHGTVTLLNDENASAVEDITSKIESRFEDVKAATHPHISYHIAEKYDLETVEDYLRDIAREKESFEVDASGIGVFTEPETVVYVPVVRTPELSELHTRIWEMLANPRLSSRAVEHYDPKNWFPHITLAQSIEKDELGEVVDLVENQDVNWEIRVDNISVLYQENGELDVRSNFRFDEF